jgi:hypothetical protein
MRPHHRNPNNKLLFSTSTLLILGALAALLHNSASAESDTRRWKNRWNFMCVDLDIAGGVHNGSKVQSWTCNGWDNQHWYYHDDGTITNQLEHRTY